MKLWLCKKKKMLSQFVPVNYWMNPEIEDLIPSGLLLKDGMVVLVDEMMMRGDPFLIDDSPYALDKCLENNRWCTVTELEIKGHTTKSVRFVAVYGDRTKRVRMLDVAWPWIVKLSSISAEETV